MHRSNYKEDIRAELEEVIENLIEAYALGTNISHLTRQLNALLEAMTDSEDVSDWDDDQEENIIEYRNDIDDFFGN